MLRNILGLLRAVVFGVEESKHMIEITDAAGLDACVEASNTAPVLLLKHSTACPTSAAAYQRVAAYLEEDGAPPCYLLKVIESRPVSNATADRFGVQHQSPQALLLSNGACVWDASHGAIDGPAITSALAKA